MRYHKQTRAEHTSPMDVDDSDLKTVYSWSTNATEDDRPGLGRNLGNFYNYLGRQLVNTLPRKAVKVLAGSDHRTFKSYSSDSTNITADDVVGAGRVLGNVYALLGNRLEGRLGAGSERLGYGPRASAIKVQKHRQSMASTLEDPGHQTSFDMDNKEVLKHCRKLLRYAK